MDFERVEALDSWEDKLQYSPALDSMDSIVNSSLLQESFDWSSPMPQDTSVPEALLADVFPRERFAESAMNTAYRPLFEGKCHMTSL